MAAGFFGSFPNTSGGGGGGGVSSLNTQTGALTLVAGSGITITPGSGTLTIASSGGGGGANQALSNLTSPTAINQDFIFDTGANVTIQTMDDSAAGTRRLLIKSGDGTGQVSGKVTLRTGDSDVASGTLILETGSGTIDGAPSGGIVIQTGDISGATNSSGISLATGEADSGNSGSIRLSPGPAAIRGLIILDGLVNTTSGEQNAAQNAISSATLLSPSTDRSVFVDTTSSAIAITMPAGVNGQEYFVVDTTGHAATNNITFIPDSLDVMGVNSTIANNNGARHFQFFSGVWYVLGGVF